MGSTAAFAFSGVLEGLPQLSTSGEAVAFNSTFRSTNATYLISEIEVSTAGSTAFMGRGFVVPSSATVLYVIPVNSTNPSTAGYRISETTSTNAPGVRLGYRRPSVLSVESTFESTIYLFTTGQTTYRVRVVAV